MVLLGGRVPLWVGLNDPWGYTIFFTKTKEIIPNMARKKAKPNEGTATTSTNGNKRPRNYSGNKKAAAKDNGPPAPSFQLPTLEDLENKAKKAKK